MVIVRCNKQSTVYLSFFEGNAVQWLSLRLLLLFVLWSFVFYQSMQVNVRMTSS